MTTKKYAASGDHVLVQVKSLAIGFRDLDTCDGEIISFDASFNNHLVVGAHIYFNPRDCLILDSQENIVAIHDENIVALDQAVS